MKKSDINSLPSIGFVRLPTILSVYPISKSKLYEDIKKGLFPAPIKKSKRISLWNVETLREFFASLAEI